MCPVWPEWQLLCIAAVVGAVILPVTDADVDSAAGLVDGHGECVLLPGDKGESFLESVGRAVDRDGDEVGAGGNCLRYNHCTIPCPFIVRGDSGCGTCRCYGAAR